MYRWQCLKGDNGQGLKAPVGTTENLKENYKGHCKYHCIDLTGRKQDYDILYKKSW